MENPLRLFRSGTFFTLARDLEQAKETLTKDFTDMPVEAIDAATFVLPKETVVLEPNELGEFLLSMHMLRASVGEVLSHSINGTAKEQIFTCIDEIRATFEQMASAPRIQK